MKCGETFFPSLWRISDHSKIESTGECTTYTSAWMCYSQERITSEGLTNQIIDAFLCIHKPHMIKAEDVRKSNVRRNCCVTVIRKHNLLCERRSLSDLEGKRGTKSRKWGNRKRMKENKKGALKGNACPCSSERTKHIIHLLFPWRHLHQLLNTWIWELSPHSSSLVPPPLHSSNLSSFFNSISLLPPSSLECSLSPHSQNPPTPHPSSSHPRLIPSLQRLVINVSFNCHAHFYAH